MTYLVELWIILESELVESAPHIIFVVWILKGYKEYYRQYSNQYIWSYLIWICYEEVMTFLPETPVLD
jgi:hypothetical protein